MLTEERYSVILEQVRQNKSVTLTALCRLLEASESTVRRDLTLLDEKGLVKKVHGGAISTDERSIKLVEHYVDSKSKMFTEAKTAIARFAASLIDDGDFVFIDAGTTTEKMIDFLPDKNVTFVTDALPHAKKLAQRGFRVYIPAGEIKLTTEAIVGAECVSSLQRYNFSKSFIGQTRFRFREVSQHQTAARQALSPQQFRTARLYTFWRIIQNSVRLRQ